MRRVDSLAALKHEAFTSHFNNLQDHNRFHDLSPTPERMTRSNQTPDHEILRS